MPLTPHLNPITKACEGLLEAALLLLAVWAEGGVFWVRACQEADIDELGRLSLGTKKRNGKTAEVEEKQQPGDGLDFPLQTSRLEAQLEEWVFAQPWNKEEREEAAHGQRGLVWAVRVLGGCGV